MTRVLALVVAIGLVVAGLLVRSARDDDADTEAGKDTVRVACAAELAEACAHLPAPDYDVVVEDAALTATRLSTDAPVTIDAWVVPDPWPAIVDDNRARAGLGDLFDPAAPAIGRSPLVAVGDSSLADCDWRCIGDADDRLGAAAPASGLGTLELGAASAGWFGGPDFAANDFDAPFRSWIAALTSRITPTDQPVTRLLQSRAFFDVALTSEADARSALASASPDRKAGLALQYPSPVAYLDVVAADVGTGRDADTDDLRSRLRTALGDLGWQEPGTTPSGLPKAGVLVALRELL